MSHVLGVSTSGYYAYRSRERKGREEKRLLLVRAIEEIHRSSRNTYGSPRVFAQLKALGYSCSLSTVERLMKAHGIKAKVKKSYRNTTDSKHALPVAPNRVEQKFHRESPNELWLGDITYLRTQEGWLYLAVILDAFSRKVIGWCFKESLHTQIVVEAFDMAVSKREISSSLVFHSDRGSQYASELYRHRLQLYGILPSMSRSGNCYDNSVVESFFHTLKAELPEVFCSRLSAKNQIFEWMEGFYNRIRLHSSLGQKSPEQFESLRGLS